MNDQANGVVERLDVTPANVAAWNRNDTTWMLGLFGTAIGAGTLFLPINAGIGGFWPLMVLAVLAFPMTFYAHRGLTRFVLSGREGADITEVVEQHFGKAAGALITLLYFFAIFPILLIYSVALTNTVGSFLEHQLHLEPPPRAILALLLIVGLLAVVRCGERFIVKAMSLMVYPFIVALLFLAVFLIPHWTGGILSTATTLPDASAFWPTLWLAIPVMVFSFNHTPIISAFAVDQKRQYGENAEVRSSQILARAHGLMVVMVLFFVFSCVLTLSPIQLAEAKAQNISILSYLANHFSNPTIAFVAPLIAFVAISKSFLGHYIGASEGLKGLIVKTGRRPAPKVLDRVTAAFMLVVCWIVATLNPSILGMIETLGGPVISALLFLMPMYAIHKVPAMRQYAGKLSNVFVVAAGVVAITALVYSLVQ
ncbi:aromatic amino acid transport family protein [Pseudomonas alliivorans]|uniref:HAAAP family serine/threonine permease n=1 Tax=Pseudomonas alliivorans TaxID=2810613 RepID=A0ABS4CBR2_9PSED|nr:aromatic amino acid transport family protein [Pseudomonas alliivorans]MBP0943040.1 HAAAP family serine/threonine permease [Pseudomonas alliivorans]MBP0948027.1 HAAAP family serine/threonine permease [Pseudomonas alliivorans]MEE4306879.1 aromatic amino acid transport family protein [Pseudomonas alliivorans]MEE4326786.1 aromatic amino acid transport family protein [Pseudomonas alliivorans]MEE4336443.1 aromatic amino acid transport family protein [Pseudomonas alliivorans]